MKTRRWQHLIKGFIYFVSEVTKPTTYVTLTVNNIVSKIKQILLDWLIIAKMCTESLLWKRSSESVST